MIDKARIEQELHAFIDWPNANDKSAITTTSVLIFANVIAEMVRDEERARYELLIKNINNGEGL